MSRYNTSITLSKPADANGDRRVEKILSRVPLGDLGVTHGFDRALGYFVDIEFNGELVVEVCSTFDGLNNGAMLGLLDALDIPLSEDQRLAIGGDFPY